MLHINGESTQGLTHAQVVERIRAGGPRLRLVLSRPLETHPGKPEGVGGPQKGDGGFPEGEGSESREGKERVAKWRGWGPGWEGLVVSVGRSEFSVFEGSWYSQKQDREGQGPRIGIKVGFRGEAFEVLGEEKGEGVWGKSRCLEGRAVVLS